jgi:hypothetical protein
MKRPDWKTSILPGRDWHANVVWVVFAANARLRSDWGFPDGLFSVNFDDIFKTKI